MRVTNDQIDKLTEVCLDIAVHRTRINSGFGRPAVSWQEVIAEFEAIGMPLADVRARMSLGEFDEAYRRFCQAHGYQS
jgi:hypothetical protein